MEARLENKIKSSRVERVLAAAGILAGAAGVFLVSAFNPSNAGFFPVCPLYAMTGLACPGCGLTRGFHALFHGDILTALDYNALLPFFLLGGIYFLVSMVLIVFRGRGLSFKIFRPGLVYGFLALAFVFAVVRNLPFYPFTILYP